MSWEKLLINQVESNTHNIFKISTDETKLNGKARQKIFTN